MLHRSMNGIVSKGAAQHPCCVGEMYGVQIVSSPLPVPKARIKTCLNSTAAVVAAETVQKQASGCVLRIARSAVPGIIEPVMNVVQIVPL